MDFGAVTDKTVDRNNVKDSQCVNKSNGKIEINRGIRGAEHLPTIRFCSAGLSQNSVTPNQNPVIIRVNEDQADPVFIAGSEVLAIEVSKETLPGWYCLFDKTGNMRFAKDVTDTSKVAHRLRLVGLCRPL